MGEKLGGAVVEGIREDLWLVLKWIKNLKKKWTKMTYATGIRKTKRVKSKTLNRISTLNVPLISLLFSKTDNLC